MPTPTPAQDFSVVLNDPGVRSTQLDVLFNDAPVGVAFVAADGTFMRINPTFGDMIGYSAYELEGRRRWQEITHPDDLAADEAEAALVLKGRKRSYRMAKKYLHKRGHSVPVDLTVDRVEGKDEEFIHFIAHAQPVQLSDEFYRIKTGPDGVPAIFPFYPAMRLVRDNWKVVLTMVGGFLTSAGAALHSHYRALAQLDAQTVQIANNNKELEALREENRKREAKTETLMDELRSTTRAIKGAHP